MNRTARHVQFVMLALMPLSLLGTAKASGQGLACPEDTAGLKEIYQEIDSLEKSQIEVERFTRYQELMAWLLVPALGLVAGEMALRKTIFRKLP